jgi:16S rRNA (guanine527-N7)-methyltransferase
MVEAGIILEWAGRNGLALDGGQLAKLAEFKGRVLEANKYMNLTAITGGEEFAVKHFIDSLSLHAWLPYGAKVVDVGTGAGFPGVPLKIARPDIELTLMDSLRKRVFFLRETLERLSISGVNCLHARAEEYNRKPEHRQSYDICAARAVARLAALAGYTLPFVKRGGLLLAMKGADVNEELDEAAPVIKKLGGEVKEVKAIEIGLGITHSVVVIGK